MAKRRGKRTVRRSARVSKARFMPYSKTANFLAILAIILLVLNAITLVFLKDMVLKALSAAGMPITTSSLALMGLMWLLVAFFAWSINRTVKEKQSRVAMWELFILSIVAMLSGRLESGALLMIASIVYLVKAKRK